MTHFEHNLPILRRRAGYTQESLAEALGVSRQAVSKWESGQTLPEAATLLTLADLLSCTLDQLMREELSETDFPPPPAPDTAAEEARFALFVAYDQHMDRFSVLMAAGVFLSVASIASILGGCLVWGETGFIVLPFFLCLAAAVFLFIWGGIAHSDFRKAHPTVPPFYNADAITAFRKIFRAGIAIGVAAILVAVALLIGLSVLWQFQPNGGAAACTVFFLIVAAAVAALVYLGIQHSKYHGSGAAQEEASWTYTPSPASDRRCGFIMSAATIIFLVAGFVFDAWHPTWIVFPVGGLLCGMVSAAGRK
ncbi:helix-turn-helix domain-containing protein [Pseudoflavonifractor sp.]|jgi:transcriptional regulator with XRE-family HTH domain|uniref:helix-turn-helix transcriptional regulator n=1 Tax=Pseudoflavonifractor sp. TaxID=1980281 RepID=UPI003D8F8825